MWLRDQLVIAAKKLGGEQNLSHIKDTNNVQKHEWTTLFVFPCGFNQCGWLCGSSKRKNMRVYFALQGGEAKEFISSSSITCKQEGGRKFPSNFPCEVKIWRIIYLLETMKSVYHKVIANQYNCNVLMKVAATFLTFSIFFRVSKSWNFEDNRNILLKLRSKLRPHHVAFTVPKKSPE